MIAKRLGEKKTTFKKGRSIFLPVRANTKFHKYKKRQRYLSKPFEPLCGLSENAPSPAYMPLL